MVIKHYQISRPFHGLYLMNPPIPAINRWAIVSRPLRGLLLSALLLGTIQLSVRAQSSAAPNKREGRSVAAIRAVLDAQAAAWNRGDIEGYMDGYARSKDTVFVSGDDVTRGWQTVLERYKKSYNSREKMGMLTFSDLQFAPMGSNTVTVIGRWHLRRANDEPHGRFTLIFKKTRQGWRIIHDHTSSA
jgi:ketosteroid isomerase-like protein